MLIRDIVEINTHGAFYSDVQVSAFRDPAENLQLARSYIFTSSLASSGQEVGSVELLEKLVASYLPGSLPNRFEVIATFGHGKSHFAVAAATYFGRATGNEAYKAINSTLDHAVNDPARVEKLRVFRQHRKPFLVILLRGDEAGDLPAKFARGLEQALADNEETKGVRPPFWFNDAETFLDGLASERRDKSDAFLEPHGYDLALLRQRVHERDDGVHDLCRDLHRALTGSYPDFQGAASLGNLVQWAADELCEEDKPFGGVFILFDEFSTFIETYGEQSRGMHASPLQELLNGVSSRRERVTFVALGQIDAREVADQHGGSQLTNIRKELDRIETRLRLKSVLEDVLDSYLKQSDHEWDRLALKDPLRVGIEETTLATFQVFKDRYSDQLKWSQAQLRDRVGYGCFPLHPMTTALFSTITLSTTGNPRSVLKFILDAVAMRADQPVVHDGVVNWVLPVALVDYFQGMLDERTWQELEEARRGLGGDITPDEHRTLQAVFLITAGTVRTSGSGYVRIAAHLSGLQMKQAEETLLQLKDRGLLRFDAHTGAYTFWPVGGGAYLAEQALMKRVQAIPSVTEQVLAEAAGILKREGELRPIEVNTNLGNSGDWAAQQSFELVSALNDPAKLRALAAPLMMKPSAPSGPRSLVVWAVPTSEADVEWARTSLAVVVDDALGDALVPLVIMRPDRVSPGFTSSLKRALALGSMSNEEIGRIGSQPYQHVRDTTYSALRQALQEFRRTAEPVTARAFRAEIASYNISAPEYALERIYRVAFARGPGAFFSTYAASNTTFGTAANVLAQLLSSNTVGNQSGLFTSNKVAKEILEKELRPRWRVLGAGESIEPPPEISPVHAGWHVLNEAFKPGLTNQPVIPVTEKLLNPPYGYDARTFLLLFSAWYGYYRDELSMRSGPIHPTPADLLKGDGKKKALTPIEFVQVLKDVSVSRENPDERRERVKIFIDEIESGKKTYSIAEAESVVAFLAQAFGESKSDPVLAKRIQPAYARINAAIAETKKYDQIAVDLLKCTENWRQANAQKLVKSVRDVSTLPKCDLVQPCQPGPVDLRAQLEDRLVNSVEEMCTQCERLQSLEKHHSQQQILKFTEKELTASPTLLKRVRAALQTLEASKVELESKQWAAQKDQETQAELNAMTLRPDVGVATLATWRDRLIAMTPHGDACQQVVKTRLKSVESALEALENQMASLESRLDQADSDSKVQQVRDELNLLKGRIMGSDLEDTLSKVEDRCDALRGFFSALADLRHKPATPTEAADMVRRLNQLGGQSERLSPSQQELVRDAQTQLTDFVQRRQTEIIELLQRLETELDAGDDPWAIESHAANVSSFLPETEQSRFQTISKRINGEKDRDISRKIAKLFDEITEESERKSLAQRLWLEAFGALPQPSTVGQ